MRRELLRLLAFDYCLLWEPLGVAERIAPRLDTDEQISLAVEGIQRLFDEQLVYLFRCDFDVDLFVNSAFSGEGRRFLVGRDGRMRVLPSAPATDSAE
jgi:hypothetical protein